MKIKREINGQLMEFELTKEELKEAHQEILASQEESLSDMFIFGDELCVQDEKTECVDGYLWATDKLVSKLQEQQGPDWKVDDVDNINFYPIYNLRENTIKVEGTYWYYPNESSTEKQAQFQLELTPEESFALINSMNLYCVQRYAMDCFDFVNIERLDHNLPILEDTIVLSNEIYSNVYEQAWLMFEDGDISSAELDRVDVCIRPITQRYLQECNKWEERNQDAIPLSIELEYMHNAISDALKHLQPKNIVSEKKLSLSEQIQAAADKVAVNSNHDLSKGVER